MRVHGIDLSPAMVERLQAKSGGEDIAVTIGDFATTTLDQTFTLVYLVFNTISNLTTQHEQVACFRNAAAHLEPGGCFVIEVGVPELRRLPPGETVRAFALSPDMSLRRVRHDAAQISYSHHFGSSTASRGLLTAVPLRVAIRARPDGAACRHDPARAMGDGRREPFRSDSTKHVSVWEKPAD